MIFGQDREGLRRMYRGAWNKRRSGKVLTPLEAQIASVVEQHPEYHEDVESDNLDIDYQPEKGRSNPFLHMGMHLAIREQVSTNRPHGISLIFDRLVAKSGNPLDAEHRMMEALGETMWEAQRNNVAPDESAYMGRLRRML